MPCATSCAYVVEHSGNPAVALIIDATDLPEQGSKSVGVQRQYKGKRAALLATADPVDHARGAPLTVRLV